jgi:Fe(3+) dicitrate transport protein
MFISSSSFLSRFILLPAASLALLSPLDAQIAAPDTELAAMVSEAESSNLVQGPFLPAVDGVKIHSGKKTSSIDLDAFPTITNNNYRQALALTPGLVLSEEATPLVSIGYRGLDPHRAQFTQVLKDGIPIHADQFGYPEAYYTPPLDTVDRIEFVRGGAALMYGPQPGGALNYITHRPRTDRPFSFGTSHTFGSDNYYSTFSYLDGTSGRLGYYAYFNHRQGDGFRTHNSDFELNAGHIKLVLDAETDSRWILTLDAYEEQHGEPGGLTFATGPNTVNYNSNRDASSRLYDLFKLKRHFAALTWERDFSEATSLSTSAWGGYYSRYSSRQRGGGFGTRPTGPDASTTSVEHQEFYTLGFETRLRHDYAWAGGDHTFAGGFQAYYTDSPRQDRRGKSRNARGGVLRNDSDREVFYLPFFAENRFAWGPFSITPGVRIENIWQRVRENRNVSKSEAGVPLANQKDGETVPLFGLGVAYELSPKVEIYGNVSQSYRPKIYTQAVPTDGTALVPNDLEESKAWQYEVGFRGNPTPWVNWDVSAFLLDFDDQIGRVALPGGLSTVGNVGRAQHRGIEAALEVDIIGLGEALWGGKPAPSGLAKDVSSKNEVPVERSFTERFGSLNVYGNIMLLDAEFVSGPLDGLTPRFAPDYVLRTGLIYRWQDRLNVAFLGTFVADAYADDANTRERFMPAYMVWDLTVEAKIYKDILSVHAGINNLFNEDYYARIRDDGIDPAAGRTYYAGFSLTF